MKIPAVILVVTLAIAGTVAAEGAAVPAAPSLQGEVLEVLDGGAFTYLRLLTPKGETWAVVRRANVGDVVIATGVVKTDVNLGSGYAYKVLVEDASFRK